MRVGAARAFAGAVLTAVCGGETTTAPGAAAEALQLRVETARFRALVELIRTNGKLSSAPGLPAPEFEAAWHAFVRQRYF